MNILWTVNIIPAPAARKLSLNPTVLGGWIEAMLAILKSNHGLQITVACKNDETQPFDLTLDNIRYISLDYSAGTSRQSLEEKCLVILDDVKPDIIHIEGTEFLHALAMKNMAQKHGIPAILSLQGILNGQYNYQCGLLPMDDMLSFSSMTDFFAALILHLRKTRWYRPRMTVERELLSDAEYVLGRTTWDRAHVHAINPNAKYFHCNRVLRDVFYHKQWDITKIERHSLYVGNGYYALKGLHFVIQAMPELIREYLDFKVYVAGYEPYRDDDKRPFFKRGYGSYLKKLIHDLHVENHIEFTGALTAEQVAERLAHVHTYILCSTVENSPNTLGEAMLVGTPCVASYCGGVPDMATDGQEALFYRSNDPALLAWNVKRIFDDDDFALALSQNARNRARITHDANRNAETLLQIYHTICHQA